jgi:hypothetical protein
MPVAGVNVAPSTPVPERARITRRHNVLLFYLGNRTAWIPALTAYATKMGRSLVGAVISNQE